MKRFYLLALAATLAFTGCKKDDGDPRPENLTIEKTEYALDAVEERTATVAFTAPANWTLSVVYDDAESSADWLSVTPMSGTAGEQTVELSAARNFRTSDRTAYADLVCGEQSVRLTVTQTAASEVVDFTAQFDPGFAQKLQELGIIADAEHITPADMEKIAAMTELDVSGTDDAPGTLTSLQGTEYFESLTDLDCSYNQLTSLDVRANTALTELYCHENQLTSLDVRANTALTYLYCGSNQLTSLDVRANTALMYLDCSSNSLTTLDVSANTALTFLMCGSNQLTELDVSRNTALTYLYCGSNQLTSLDVRANTALTLLSCSFNSLTTLDVSRNTALTHLSCDSNQLESLDVSANTALTELSCSSNSLTSLDVSANTALTYLWCGSNQLTSLDVRANTALTQLTCSYNQLTELDVRANTALTDLYCFSNQLTSLDISRNTVLTELSCSDNPGDGESTFPVTVWFDNETEPAGLKVYSSSWTYGGKTITIDFRKAE